MGLGYTGTAVAPHCSLLTKLGVWGGWGQRGADMPPLPIHTHPLWIHVWPPSSSSHTKGIPKHWQAVDPSNQLLHKPPELWDPSKTLCTLHPILAHSNPWAPRAPHRMPALALPGPADVNGATRSPSRNGKSQPLGRAVGSGGSGGSGSSLGTSAMPGCPLAQLRDDPWRPMDKRRIHLGFPSP